MSELRILHPARWLGLTAFVAWCSVSPSASAQAPAAGDAPVPDEKQVCSAAFEQAQRLLNETKYLAANQEILKCANPKCGDALSQECSRLYNEVQAAQPTVVFSVRDAAKGIDLFDVSISIDGQASASKPDGKALPVDPGNHTFTFTAAGYAPIEQQAVVRSGEKFRQISVVFGAQAAAAPTAPVAPTTAPPVENLPAPEPAPRKVPVASYVLGGIGVVGIGVGIAFRAIGSSQYDQLERDCKPNCPQSDIDKVKSKYTLSYVGLGVGAAALVGAVTVYLAQPRESAPVTAFTVAPMRDGVSAAVLGRF